MNEVGDEAARNTRSKIAETFPMDRGSVNDPANRVLATGSSAYRSSAARTSAIDAWWA